MKRTSIIIVLIFSISTGLISQAQYEKGMSKAFELIKDRKIDESVALFERISQAEESKWLPAFHGAHTLIWSSFGIDEKTKREAALEKAKLLVAEAHKRSDNNAEIYSLEAMLYTSYMAFDPAIYGMMYAMKVEGLHNKAFQLEPTNPRVLSGKIQYARGKAGFFGEDQSIYCEKMKQIIPKFKAEISSELFAPNHGLQEAEMFVKSCNG